MSLASLVVPLALVTGQVDNARFIVPDPELAQLHGTPPVIDYRNMRAIMDGPLRADSYVTANLLRSQTDGWVNWMGLQIRAGL